MTTTLTVVSSSVGNCETAAKLNTSAQICSQEGLVRCKHAIY